MRRAVGNMEEKVPNSMDLN